MSKQAKKSDQVTPPEPTARQLEIERMKAKILEVRQPVAYLVARPSSTPWAPPMGRPTYTPPRVQSNREGSDDFLQIQSHGFQGSKS